MVTLNWRLRLIPGLFGFLLPHEQGWKEREIILSGVLDFDFKGEIRFPGYSEDKEEHIWNLRQPLPPATTMPSGKSQWKTSGIYVSESLKAQTF